MLSKCGHPLHKGMQEVWGGDSGDWGRRLGWIFAKIELRITFFVLKLAQQYFKLSHI